MFFKRTKNTQDAPTKRGGLLDRIFTSKRAVDHQTLRRKDAIARIYQVEPADYKTPDGVTFDSSNGINLKIDADQFDARMLQWFANQSFIGHRACAVMAQNWLIAKACDMPARDSIRTGYEVMRTDGVELPTEVVDEIRNQDKHFGIERATREFIRQGKIFGIRVAVFKIDGVDYSAPFNPDGIQPGAYKGIVQVDPYWCVPEMVGSDMQDPTSENFYNPEFWIIGTQRYHRSHLVIFRTGEVADSLKHTYRFGGIPLPQQIFERVYAAEITANEAPKLAQTKRTDILNIDLDAKDEQTLEESLSEWTRLRDNYGIKALGLDEQLQRLDTTLTDFDNLIMVQYQLVAAIARVPATKLLGTTPKGFQSTGEFEESSYHEELESLQSNDISPFLERHHLCLIRSHIAPKFPDVGIFETTVSFNPLDTPTAKEWAELNKLKAETGTALVNIGALTSDDERARIANDPNSGYTGIELNQIDNELDTAIGVLEDVATKL